MDVLLTRRPFPYGFGVPGGHPGLDVDLVGKHESALVRDVSG